MRAGMGFAAADPGDLTDGSALDRPDSLERLGRVAEVLEVTAENARLLDLLEHPARLRGGPAERLGAQDGFAGLGGEADRFLMEEVRGAHDHHVGIGMLDRSLHIRRRLADGPALFEGGTALRAARVDDADTVATALRVEGHGIEVADQPGAEQGHVVLLHRSRFYGCRLRPSELFELRHAG